MDAEERARLRAIHDELQPSDHRPLVWAKSETKSLDETVALIRSKLAFYPERHTIYAVQTDDDDPDGFTLCLTGNGPNAAANAEWLSVVVPAVPILLDALDAAEAERDAAQQESEIRGQIIAMYGLASTHEALEEAKSEVERLRDVEVECDAASAALRNAKAELAQFVADYESLARRKRHAECERDAARRQQAALRTFVTWLHTETFRINDDGSIPWTLWSDVQERARAVLAATATEGK